MLNTPKPPKLRWQLNILQVFFILTTLFLFVSSLGFFQESLAEKGIGQENTISADAFIQSEAGHYFQTGNYEEAIPTLDNLLTQYPGDSLLIRYRAIALDRLGQSKEAISIFRDLLTEDPGHIPTHYFLAQAYARNGQVKEAVGEWEWIVEQREGSVYETWALSALESAGAVQLSAETKELLRWYIVAQYGYEYDSNVILRPDDDTLATSRDHNAGRQVLDLAMRYRAFSRRDVAVDLLYEVNQTIHDDSLNEFNFHSEDFGLNARKRVQIRNQDVVLGLRYDLLVGFLETDLFSVRNRWRLSGDTRFSPRTRTVFYDRVTLAEFGPDGFDPERTSRDGVYNDVGVTHYFYSSDYKRFAYILQEFNSGHTRGRNYDYVGSQTRLGIHMPLLEKLDLDLSTGLQARFYHNFSSVSVLDQSRRRDFYWDVYSSLTYHLTPNIGVSGIYRFFNGYNQNNFYDYTRHIGGVQIAYSRKF